MTTDEQTQYDALASERDALKEQVDKLTRDVATASKARDVYKTGFDKQAGQLTTLAARIRILQASQPVIRERIQAAKDLADGNPVALAAAQAPDA